MNVDDVIALAEAAETDEQARAVLQDLLLEIEPETQRWFERASRYAESARGDGAYVVTLDRSALRRRLRGDRSSLPFDISTFQADDFDASRPQSWTSALRRHKRTILYIAPMANPTRRDGR